MKSSDGLSYPKLNSGLPLKGWTAWSGRPIEIKKYMLYGYFISITNFAGKVVYMTLSFPNFENIECEWTLGTNPAGHFKAKLT